jgi:hypothetical protein
MGSCTGPLHFSGFFVPCINECVRVGFSHLAGIGFMCVVAFVIIDNIRLITLDIVMKSRNLGPFLFISDIVSQECQLRECPVPLMLWSSFLVPIALMSGALLDAQWLPPPSCYAAQSASSPVRRPAYAPSRAKHSHLTRAVPGQNCVKLWRPAATSVRSVGAFAGLQRPISCSLRRSSSS